MNGPSALNTAAMTARGVAVLNGGRSPWNARVGKISALAEKLKGTTSPNGGHRAIRAGRPRRPDGGERAPHVSYDGKFAVVHNGIIENYAALKAKLQSEAWSSSPRRTEVIAHLLAKLCWATSTGCRAPDPGMLEGAFGLAILCRKLRARSSARATGSPLVLGIGEGGEYFLASDVSAIVNYTQKVVYLDDNDVASPGAAVMRS